MYAAVRRYEGVTDLQEAARLVSEGFVPLISQVPGFLAYYWVDAGGGVMISTGVFEDLVLQRDITHEVSSRRTVRRRWEQYAA